MHPDRYPHVVRTFFCLIAVAVAAGVLGGRTLEAASPALRPLVAPQPSERMERLADRLDRLIESHDGRTAIAVVNLETGESLYRNADEPMPTASLIKLAVLIEAYRQDAAGTISLDETISLRDEDKVPGSGILTTHFTPGMTLTVRDAVRLMIAFSDNTATNLVLDKTSLKAVNETMARLGCPETSIHAKVYRRDTSIAPERSRQFGLGSTTARQMISLLGRLHRREIVSSAACEAMLEHLEACDDTLKIRRGLPAGAKWAHKTGSINASRTDAGLLETPSGTIAICVLTTDNNDTSWGDSNAGDLFCSAVGEAVSRTFSRGTGGRRLATNDAPDGSLSIGSYGDLVADLQRTLNARDSQSRLSIDGEFGPATKAAVERFQQEHDLDVTGIVGPETWKSLGPIVTSDAPVPDPAEIAAEAARLPVRPAEDPKAPPFVTCAAWAIGDAETGEILWNHNGDQPRHMASTTKIMAAYVVLELAANDPAILDEIVTFSRRADDTRGSTAGIRQGERLTVRELLYGLLLPSGNDAATAFAEHFGPRLAPPDEWPSDADRSDPAEHFIAEMNRAAKRLGLTGTTFRNPHGLSADRHRATAADLVRLAQASLKHDLFRKIVSTRLHGCTVTGPGGYTRNVRWENTNRLLGTTGYGGVKTGTTNAAGACLVSLGDCNIAEDHTGGDVAGGGAGSLSDRKLIVAVLGATSSDARYVDTRNLFRWARSELQSR